MHPDAPDSTCPPSCDRPKSSSTSCSPSSPTSSIRLFTDEQVAENLKLFDLLGIEGADERLDRSILDEVYQNGPTA